ncbi:MAG: transposase [Caldilineaceae bacterium]
MKLTAKVRLTPTEAQAESLKRTLEKANTACDYISQRAWDMRTFGKFQIQKLVYEDVRKTFDLTAQVVIRCIAKVSDAYKIDKETKREFKPHGSIAFDARILSWKLAKHEVSIWTVDGRQKIGFVCHARAKELLSGDRGESDLCMINGKFYLFTSCEVNEPSPQDVDDFLGVDLGVTNIAVDSDRDIHSAKAVNNVRFRHRHLRAKLQSKGTKSSRHRLKKLSGKERRFATWVNHKISKSIVQKAKDTDRGVALEDLSGLRERVTVRKAQRAQLHSWSFHQLRSFIDYKAKQMGVKVVAVDPRNTSRTCLCCSHVDKANRPAQSKFSCVVCGYSDLADYVAARNIASRAAVSQPHISATVSITRQ